MANNNVAYGRNGAPDFFADDDPLAELARIAGYEERPAARPALGESHRREPAFNLEDELLREFEGYDAPRDEAHPDPLPSPIVQGQASAEPHHDSVAISAHDPFSEPDPFIEPAFPSWVDDAPVVSAMEQPQPVTQFRASAPVSMPASKSVDASLSNPATGNHGGFEADLIAELETSLMPVATAQSSQKSSRPLAKAYEPGFRMPLANFNAANAPRHEPAVRQDVTSASQVDVSASPFAPESVLPSAEKSLAAAPSTQSIWEAELARVAAFAVAPAVQREFAQSISSVDPLSELERRAPVSAPVDEPIFEKAQPEKIEPVAVLDKEAASAHAPSSDVPLLVDEDFELALDDLDLDFSDLEAEPVGAVSVAQTPKQEERPEPVVSVARQAAEMQPQSMHAGNPYGLGSTAKVASAEPTVAAVPSFLMNSRSAAAMGAPAVEAKQATPAAVDAGFAGDTEGFDPALLADADEMPETVPDLNVPELPPHEPEKPVAVHSEYDIDLDAELASFLDSANIAPRAPEAPRARAATAKPEPVQTKSQADDGLDDFERALEEDFRRSLATPFPGRAALEADEESQEEYGAGRRGFSGWVVPASVAGFVGIAGIALFAWYASEGSKFSGDGAPVVIAADTDPVKVAPENPGGKIVPNQDKAVYDRVATGTLDAPKQQSLITSDEQPMDVVQKTLVPESMPLEGEDELDADGAPVGQAQDARLTSQDAAAPAGSQDQLAVMPRKVKTMIVRPDGTLVEQVTDAPASSPVATVAKAEKIPAAPALAEPSHSNGATSGIAADQTKLADVKIAKATAITGTSSVPATTPATPPVATTQKASAAPVPATRPAEQPVQVVASVSSQGNVRPTPASAPVANTAVAAATPAASASSGAGGYFIQVASLPSEADAQKSYKNLSAKFGNVIGGRGVDIAKADIAGKGTFYRVRIPAGNSKDEAAALCEKLRAAGGTCLIAR